MIPYVVNLSHNRSNFAESDCILFSIDFNNGFAHLFRRIIDPTSAVSLMSSILSLTSEASAAPGVSSSLSPLSICFWKVLAESPTYVVSFASLLTLISVVSASLSMEATCAAT